MRRSQKDTDESARKIRRRGLIMGGLQAGLLGILALRMRYLQVDEADEYRLLAEENRINVRLLPPARGLIFDRNGVLIAGNAQNYRVVLVREDAGDVDAVLQKLVSLVPIPPDSLRKAAKELKRRSDFVPVTVADQLSWDDIATVAVNAPALPGVTPEVGLSRSYPLRDDFAHVVGYVGPVSEYDLSRLDDKDPLLEIPKFQIGKVGVEQRLERSLRGSAGFKRIEVNAVGRVMRELDRDEGKSGDNVQLSINARLQNFVHARMAGESAAAVIIDTENGDIVAMASTPAFDPNKFVRGISSADYRVLTGDKYRPLANKAVHGTYPPGSTYKMVTTLAAMEAGLVSAEETVYCPGYRVVAGRRFHCWKSSGHGNMNMHDALAQSCDVYFYDMAERIGIERMSGMARRLGLGERFDIATSGIAGGLIPSREWKMANQGADWMVGDSVNAVIGQGFVATSPLQLAVMTARLATGRSVTPRLLRSVNGIEQPSGAGLPLDVPEHALNAARQGMISVSNQRRGTAYRSRVENPALRIAGKTGTSQVRNITAAERASGVIKNEDLPWERRDHALFVSFGPVDAPRYAAAVVVEHGGGGSTAAAPVARDIMLYAMNDGLPPLSDYPERDRNDIEARFAALDLRDIAPESDGKFRA